MGDPKIRSHRIKTPEPIEIKFGTVDEETHNAKFYANPSKASLSANGWNICKKFSLYRVVQKKRHKVYGTITESYGFQQYVLKEILYMTKVIV